MSEAGRSLLGRRTEAPIIASLPDGHHRLHPRRLLSSVSCKARKSRRNVSRKLVKRIPQDESAVKENAAVSDDGILAGDGTFSARIGAYSVHDNGQAPKVQVKDLVDMIKNAEKNILLLNGARVHALEDMHKILDEKEMLQGQVRNLEKKLAESNRLIIVATQKLENNFLENELSKTNGREVRDHEDPTSIFNKDSSLNEDVNNMRKENTQFRNSIKILETKLNNAKEKDEILHLLEKELESRFVRAQQDASRISMLNSECEDLRENVKSLQVLLDSATRQANQSGKILEQNDELQKKVEKLEASLKMVKADKLLLVKTQQDNEALQQKIKILENHIQLSDQEINSHIQLYQASVKEFQDTLNNLKVKSKRKSTEKAADDIPREFWTHLLLMIDAWLLEKRISANNANLLRDMVWMRDDQIRNAYFMCIDKPTNEVVATFLKLTSSRTSCGLNIVHIAAEMAPVAKVGGLGDVVSGLCKELQKKGNHVEVVVPKYDCLKTEHITGLRLLDVVIESYFDGQNFKNKIWVGIVEGLPVYFIESNHPAKFFHRGQVYGEHDDFKRFSFFSRAALELLHQAGKRPDIIHCHDWHTAFVAPLYWEVYAPKGFTSARICFTCHNFEYQGIAPASELASCGLDVQNLHRPDRMQDNSCQDRVNLVKGATVFSNIVTTVSPTYAKEVLTREGGRGLHHTLNLHLKKFLGILNGIDTNTWNPSRDLFLSFQYNAEDLRGKTKNKDAIRKFMKLSSDNPSQPLVGCITRLVPQKGVHLIRHALYRTLELGGQFVLLGSSPVPHIQREFEDIANRFLNHPHVRLILKYDESLSHFLYAASDMLVVPSIFEPCGLTQMIAMRYGSVPIVRRTGGLNDSVFDVYDDAIPIHIRNGFTFLSADEQGLSNALERAFDLYTKNPERWQQLIQKNMRSDFSWDSSSTKYEGLYQKAVARAKARRDIQQQASP